MRAGGAYRPTANEGDAHGMLRFDFIAENARLDRGYFDFLRKRAVQLSPAVRIWTCDLARQAGTVTLLLPSFFSTHFRVSVSGGITKMCKFRKKWVNLGADRLGWTGCAKSDISDSLFISI